MFCWKWEQKNRLILDEGEVAIVMEIAEVKDRDDRKDKLPALRNVPKKKLLEETANTKLVFTKTN